MREDWWLDVDFLVDDGQVENREGGRVSFQAKAYQTSDGPGAKGRPQGSSGRVGGHGQEVPCTLARQGGYNRRPMHERSAL